MKGFRCLVVAGALLAGALLGPYGAAQETSGRAQSKEPPAVCPWVILPLILRICTWSGVALTSSSAVVPKLWKVLLPTFPVRSARLKLPVTVCMAAAVERGVPAIGF